MILNERNNFKSDNFYSVEAVVDKYDMLLEATQATVSSKRKKIEDLVLKFFSIIDTSGKNTKKYKEFYAQMSDGEFSAYMNNFIKDEKANFYLEIFPFEFEPNLKDIKAAADFLGIELDEYVYLPFENPGGHAPRTMTPVMVGYLPGKRMRAKRFFEILFSRIIRIREAY